MAQTDAFARHLYSEWSDIRRGDLVCHFKESSLNMLVHYFLLWSPVPLIGNLSIA